MKLISLAILATLLTAASTFADASSDEKSVEQVYLALCQPNSSFAKSMSEKDKKAAAQMRPQFLSFIANPAPVIEKLKNSDILNKDAGLEGLGSMLAFIMTCHTADMIDSRAQSRGCVDTKGRRYSTRKAVKLCAPLKEAVKKMQEESGEE